MDVDGIPVVVEGSSFISNFIHLLLTLLSTVHAMDVDGIIDAEVMEVDELIEGASLHFNLLSIIYSRCLLRPIQMAWISMRPKVRRFPPNFYSLFINDILYS